MNDGFVCHVNELDALPGAVYIGRRANRFGLEQSPFHNPYKVTDLGREAVIREYIDYLIREPELLRRLPELRGKPLACWCRRSDQAEPPCHGDVLLRILEIVPDDLLRNCKPVTNASDVLYTAHHGWAMYVVEMQSMGDQIYRQLYPPTEAVHG